MTICLFMWSRSREFDQRPSKPFGHAALLANPLADSEDMTIRMPHMHFANVPGHVGWRPGDVQTLVEATLVNDVHIFHPDGHPSSLVSRFVAIRTKRPAVRSLTSAALTALAQEDFAVPGAHASERGRAAPVPGFRPSELFKPRETLLNVRDIQNWRQTLGIH